MMNLIKISTKKILQRLKKMIDEKLALKEKVDKISPEMVEIAKDGVLKFGRCSIFYLMRKLKCSHSMAKEICAQLNTPP